jgi:hypothetical protein
MLPVKRCQRPIFLDPSDTFFSNQNLCFMLQFIGNSTMNFKSSIGLALAFCGLLLFTSARVSTSITQSAHTSPSAALHPVVLELFTSEGCSSCPPADALLKKLDEVGQIGDVEILVLEEHVDYWNHLGWTDPFSSHDWTERQEQYARSLRHDGIYTPQLVLNGSIDLVGNSERAVLRQISELRKTPEVAMRISSFNLSSKSAQIAIEFESSSSDLHSADLCLAVTERGLSSDVRQGENQGRNLAHAAVLRSLTHVRMPQAGSSQAAASVSLDKAWKPENLRVVAFLQDRKSLHILGAAASSVSH